MVVLRSTAELASWETGAVVFTIGFFDGVHRGHQALLNALTGAASDRRATSLAITFSNSPGGYHHPGKQYPHLTIPEEKLLLLRDTGVDATLMLSYDEPIASQDAAGFIRGLGTCTPLAALCIGYDSRLGCDQVTGHAGFTELARRLSLDLVFVEALTDGGQPVKSQRVREHVCRGEMPLARRLLGHPYFVLSEVQRGKGKGRARLGVPTANLTLPPSKLAPPAGVYACIGQVGGRSYPAAVCVMSAAQHVHTALEHGESEPGQPPGSNSAVIEAHLIGYDGSIYGQELRLDFIERLREWRDFDTPEALHAQIERDIADTLAVVGQEPGVLEDGDV